MMRERNQGSCLSLLSSMNFFSFEGTGSKKSKQKTIRGILAQSKKGLLVQLSTPLLLDRVDHSLRHPKALQARRHPTVNRSL